MCDAFDTYLYKFKYRYIGHHTSVTPFEFLPPFRKPKNAEIHKRSGVRAVVIGGSDNFLLPLQDILAPDLSFIFGKMQAIS